MAQEIDRLEKADLIAFFNTYIHPNSRRAKLSILLKSQRIQPDTLAPLLELIPAGNLEEAKAHFDSKPTIDQLRSFTEKIAPENKHLAAAVKELAVPPPLPSGAKEIVDVEGFRASLEPGPRIVPVDDFRSDLVARL